MEGENIGEFGEFVVIRQIFTLQNVLVYSLQKKVRQYFTIRKLRKCVFVNILPLQIFPVYGI